jgi:hypothetical protein
MSQSIAIFRIKADSGIPMRTAATAKSSRKVTGSRMVRLISCCQSPRRLSFGSVGLVCACIA